ncbi:hypothetical protein AK812_SmicGene7934 [Symbiodinium microadriaticum]|uniref:Uncharacterized protein n=1 Tax=Symbiodinium microadriaticum TaxID=2951 RepID=A0A1Q9EMB1_SYMMI|nr:hypothetical protein AK812_SmicGene7934 [Symbiodinium microadriaticum]
MVILRSDIPEAASCDHGWSLSSTPRVRALRWGKALAFAVGQMLGPRRGLAVGSSRSTATKAPRAPVHASRSRSRGGNEKRKEKKGKEDKKEKEFAWMDSDEESKEEKKASPSSPASSKSEKKEERPVRLEEVQSLGQMARLAPSLEKRLKHGQLRSRELCEVVSALQRSKFFDGGLFEVLAAELRRAFDRRSLSYPGA